MSGHNPAFGLRTNERLIQSLAGQVDFDPTRNRGYLPLLGPKGDLALTSERVIFVDSKPKNDQGFEIPLVDIQTARYGLLAKLQVITKGQRGLTFSVFDFDRGKPAQQWVASLIAEIDRVEGHR